MPIIDRPVLVDRPVLIDRDSEEGQEDEQDTDAQVVQQLGTGGGPVVNNVEFERGDYDIAVASNVAAILTTADEEGPEFNRAFATAAIQLKDLTEVGEGITDLVRFGLEKNIGEIGMSDEDIDLLRSEPSTEEVSDSSGPDVNIEDVTTEEREQEQLDEDEMVDETSEDEESDLDDVEESIEEVKQEEEETDEE